MTSETVKFTSAASFNVGNEPFSLAVGDFNSDGLADLVSANYKDNNVSILIGNGKGSFSSATKFAVGNKPFYLTQGDFNGDGFVDLATVNYQDDTISILLGDGQGSFGSPTNFAAGKAPISIATGDFNHDGFSDLAVADDVSNLSVLLGDGKGKFGSPTKFAIGTSPIAISVGDFNGDGVSDLVAANVGENKDASVLLGNGKGGFGAATSVAVGATPAFAAVGDFNRDGFADLATANYQTENISILLGNGKGGFGTATNFAAGNKPLSIAVGDFNGDGLSDIATANMSDNNVSVILGDGKGRFGTPTKLAVGNSPGFVTVGDFNGDGISDLVTANRGTDDVSILLNNTGIKPSNNSPVIGKSIANQTVFTGSVLKFVVDGNAFTDADPGDVLTYSAKLANGKSLPTWLTFDAKTRTFTGTPRVADIDNLNIVVTATDRSGATVTNNFGLNVNAAVITPPKNPTTVIDLQSVSDQPVQATFSVKRDATYDNRVSFYKVEDTQGTIISKTGTKLKPTDSGYLAAAVENRLTNIDLLGINGKTTTSTSTLRGGAIYAPLINANDRVYNRNHLASIYTAYSAANADKAEHVKLLGNNTFGFEDFKNGGDKDFNDIIVQASLTIAPPIVNGTKNLPIDIVKFDSKLSNNPTGVNIDLVNYPGQTLKADITNSGSSVYNNNIGFYVVEDSIGSIRLSDGKLLKPGDPNYAAEAAKNALANSLQAGKNDTRTDLNIAGGKIYAPIVVAQGTLNDFITKNPTNGGGTNNIHAYFNYLAANSDKTDHFSLIGNNTFGVEDTFGGGDRDFNDLVVNLNVKSVV
jgi:hypothetical protein